MRNNHASFILASFVVAAVASSTALTTTGCDGGGGGGGGGGAGGGADAACFDYSKFDGMSPAVSFKADVLPFFQNSCGVSSSCHGDPNQPDDKRPYLGPNKDTTATDTDIQAIIDAIVGVQSYFEPTMSIVKAGEPENSFLLYKLDDTLDCGKLTCGSDCGSIMPLGVSKPLEQADRDKVRRWIAQGAKNN